MSSGTHSRRLCAVTALALASAAGAALVGLTPVTAGALPSAGAAGQAAVYSGYRDQFQLTTAANGQVEVGRLNLPAGSYAVFAKLNVAVAGGDNETIRCYLKAGGDFDRSIANHDGTIAAVPMSLNVVHTYAAPGVVTLTCGHDVTRGSTPLTFIKITAIRASSLSNTPMR